MKMMLIFPLVLKVCSGSFDNSNSATLHWIRRLPGSGGIRPKDIDFE
jgi:hypothetical protein